MTNDVIDADQRSQNHINHEVIDNEMHDMILERLLESERLSIDNSMSTWCRWEYDQTTDPLTWRKLEHEN